MASEAAHLAKADSNQSFLETIGDEYPDWLAVVAFYKAVHLVEALFAREGTQSKNHTGRNRRLKKRHPAIWKAFSPLFNASKLLRYTDHKISAHKVRQELIANRLTTVESLIRNKLSAKRAHKRAQAKVNHYPPSTSH